MMIKLIVYSIFIICLSLPLVSVALANDTFDDIIEEILPTNKLTKNQLINLKKEMSIQKLFIEGVQSIQIRGGQFVDIEKSTSTIHDLLINSISERSAQLGAEAQERAIEAVSDGYNRNTIKTVLRKTRDYAYNFAKGKKVFSGALIRRYGFDVGIVHFLAIQIDYTLPWFMMSRGHPEFGILLGLPISSSTTGLYVAAKSAIKYRQFVRRLGGFKKAIKHFNIEQKVRRFLGQEIFKSYNMFDIYSNGKTYAITVEKRNLINRTLQKLGWKKGLNYENLIRYMDENAILPKLVEKMTASNKSPTHKLLKLIHGISESSDKNGFHTIRKEFGKYINEINELPEFSKQRKWAMKLMDSRSMDSFIKTLARMPKDIPPSIFDKIWRQKILVGISKSIENYSSKSHYQAFRMLINDYDKNLRAEFTKSINTDFSTTQRKIFGDYIYKAMANFGICQQIFKVKSEKSIPFL